MYYFARWILEAGPVLQSVLEFAEKHHISPALVIITLVALFLLAWPPISRSSRHGRGPSSHIAFQALLSFIRPTQSQWPKHYEEGMRELSYQEHTINISLNDFIRDIREGQAELRAADDLAELFRNQLKAYGWSICLKVTPADRLRPLKWILTSQLQFSSDPKMFISGPSNTLRAALPRFDKFAPTLRGVSGPISHDSREFSSSLRCDQLSLYQIPSALRTLQRSLHGGEITTLELTTIASDIDFLSDGFLLCSIPFFLRAQDQKRKQTSYTSTPLFLTLHRLIELLAIYAPGLTIRNIHNISPTFAATLRDRSELQDDSVLKNLSPKILEMKSWRQHQLMLAWEAGLLDAGYLQRWKVIVQKSHW